MNTARAKLVDLLQRAYSGELGAALAYNGHWKSVQSRTERDEIRKIEEDELRHRRHVGEILAELGERPDPRRERKLRIIGRCIGIVCHVSGWFLPMYGAGRLEQKNIGEYETAARLARDAGLDRYVHALLDMAEVEWDHEQYFRTKVLSHWLSRIFPVWTAPGVRGEIRGSFLKEAASREPVPASS